MRLMSVFKVLMGTVAISFASSASAAFISTDWKTEGDGLVVTDESTGIEWLSLTVTNDASFNASVARTQAGGDLEGWLLPTYADMDQMINNFFPNSPAIKNGYFNITGEEQTRYFDLFGMTHGDRSAGYFTKADGTSISFTGVLAPNRHFGLNQVTRSKTQVATPYSTYLISNGGVSYSSINDPSLNENNPNAPASSEPVGVPEPATLAIFGLGLAGLAYRRKGVAK